VIEYRTATAACENPSQTAPNHSRQVLEIIRIPQENAMRAWSLAFTALVLVALPGCGYNALQRQDEDVKAAWSEVLNQYQRRAELIPNLVRTVKGYANQELQVLIGVTEARAKEAGSIQLTPELVNDPAAFAKLQAVQGQLSAALKNLFAVTEAYPQLQSNANFRDLQVALEGTENRIAVARNRYIDAVRAYNITVRSFPSNLTARLFDFQVKPNFAVANEQAVSQAPTVDFGDTPSRQPTAAPPVAK
jgi:LemA protein